MADHPIHRAGPDARPPSDYTTLTDVIDGYRNSGFGGDFFAEPGGTVRCGTCGSVLAADELQMESLRRLEGASDPADMQAVVATSCKICGADGTLVVAFGAAASDVDADVFRLLDDQRDRAGLPADAAPDEADGVPDDDAGDQQAAVRGDAGAGRSESMRSADVANGEHLADDEGRTRDV